MGIVSRKIPKRLGSNISVVAILVTLGLSWTYLDAIQSGTVQSPGALSALKFGTGWIYLGDIDIKSQKWATILKHRVKQRRVENASIVPLSGDILEITMQQEVFIVDYRLKGEANRLISPAGRPFEKSDLTGVKLAIGTEVLVEDVTRDPPGFSRNLQGIWTRVVAPPAR